MTVSLGRLSIPSSPLRLPAHPKRASTSSTQPRSGPTQRGGRNLGLRYLPLESSIRNIARNAALLEEVTNTTRSVGKQNFVPVHNNPRVPREETEIFRGVVVPKEPKPPESEGGFFLLLHLELDNEGACV